MGKLVKCDLCEKLFPTVCKTTMVNKINKKTIDVCPKCFKNNWGKAEDNIG